MRSAVAGINRGAALLALALGAVMARGAGDPVARRPSVWPPRGAAERMAIARDAWISDAGREREGNNGGEARLKLKGIQEMALFDAPLAGLKGRHVTGALLHMKCLSPAAPARRVSISTVATPWVEGAGRAYARQEGSVSFASPALGQRDWAYPGSSLVDAAWGKGNTLWSFADATPPDADGWQTVAIEPAVVAANVAGLSHGFAAQDDVGSEWSLAGGVFAHHLFPNRYFASREQHGAAPWLEIWTAGQDREPPQAVRELSVVTKGLPGGQALVKWLTPADRGGGRTLGFHVSYDAGQGERGMPRYLVPMAREAGAEVRMLVQDLGLRRGQGLRLTVAPVDAAGNVGPPCVQSLTVSDEPSAFAIRDAGIEPFAPQERLPEVGGLKVAVLDMLDKVEARGGRLVPDHPAGYKGGNHLWSGASRLVRLQAARNETSAFVLNLEGQSAAVTVQLVFPPAAGVRTALYRLDCVETGAGMMPDAAVPLAGSFSLPPADDPQAADAANISLLCELHVPHGAAAGPRQGTLTVAAGGETLTLAVALTVWDFSLPDKLSFVPEMNAYGTANPTANLGYYRLAHEHRACLNRLYYTWRCEVHEQAAPRVEGDSYDWSLFDRDFAPLLDGSAFVDLPRRSEPVDLFYLPINENWPLPLKPHYRPSYWADEAFDAAYSDGLRRAGAEFARHFNARGWTNTVFQFYLNNKLFFKKGRPFDSIPAPWIFDEPVNLQDFWALRWYGMLFKQGIARHPGPARLWVRGDISRTEFSRDVLRGVLDIEVMGGASAQKARMKRDEQCLSGPACHTEYGTANDPRDANLQPVLWSLLAWSRGSRGVLPWQTIASAQAWDKGEATGLFYPAPGGPVASIRLKAFTRGQQDIEYLTLLADATGTPLFAMAEGMRRLVELAGTRQSDSELDAGTLRFEHADAVALWRLRTGAGAMLSERRLAYKREVRPWPAPVRFDDAPPPFGYVTVAPPVAAAVPRME